MDTYFYVGFSCVQWGRCVKACRENSQDFLTGVRDDCPHQSTDYVPCHHCEGFWNNKTPCQEVCHYNTIEIERR